MNIYLLYNDAVRGYDTYNSAVVRAESEDEARMMHPSGFEWDGTEANCWGNWCGATQVRVTLLGTAADSTSKGVVCASYNAG